MGDLCYHCRKIGQGFPRVMFYINFVELLPLMLHAKFQNHRPSGSGDGRRIDGRRTDALSSPEPKGHKVVM